jgi:DNA-binding IclR family transcriptional regulator
MTTGPNTLRTLDKTVRIVEYLEEANGARVTELAEALSVSKGTVHKHLSTLRYHDYVVKEGDRYQLSLRFAYFGEFVKTRKETYARARAMARELTEETGLESGVLVEENGRGVYLKTETEDDSNPSRSPQLGSQEPLHVSAAGKAILAALPDDRVDQIVDRHGLPRATDRTITDRDELVEELDTIRRRGFALNRGENKRGIRALGAAIDDRNGTVLGGVSLTIPEYRATDEWYEAIAPVVRDAVDEFERSH